MSTYPFQMPSGVNIVPDVSGINNIGSISFPFNGIYLNTLNNSPLSTQVYFEKPTGDINGINTSFVLLNAPVSNVAMVCENGIFLTPSGVYSDYDYYVSGTTIVTTTPPASGSKLWVNYIY